MTVSTRPSGGRRLRFLLLGAAAWLALSAHGMAAETPAPAAPPASATEPAPASAAAEAVPAEDLFTTEELRTLLAPFALYPDQLLAQLLPASAYPVDIVMAARWLDKNEAAVEKGDFAGADAQGWDPSVKALVRFPTIIEKLNTDLDATSDLGDAFVNQPEDVADVIQALRREAQKAGSLKSTPQQTVTVRQQTSGSSGAVNDYVVIEPAEPGVIYVPTYDPAVVYYEDDSDLATGLIGFGVGVAVGAAIDNAWDWGRGWVYPPRWPGYPGYRPGIGGGINNGNINIGNEVNIGSGNTRPWRPDPGKYHPGQGSKPGLAATARPGGGVNRTNLGERANAGDRVKAGDRAALADRAEGLGAGARAGGGDLAGKKAAAGEKLAGAKADGKLDGGKADGIRNAAAAKGAGGGKAADKVANAKAAGVKKPEGGVNKAGAKQAVANKGAGKSGGKPAMQQRPSPQRPANTAFSGASFGGGAAGAMANRGAASRQSVARPGGGGRPQMARGGGGGGGPMMRGGGGGGRGGRR